MLSEAGSGSAQSQGGEDRGPPNSVEKPGAILSVGGQALPLLLRALRGNSRSERQGPYLVPSACLGRLLFTALGQ